MKEGHYITTEFPSEIIPSGTSYILWLASWYPSKTVPYNGDFIQRHAYAMSLYHQVIIVHTIHDPEAKSPLYYDVTIRNNLAELIVYFRDKGPSISFVHKLHYNLRFFRESKKVIRQLFSMYGLPDVVHVHVPMKQGKIALWIKRKWHLPYLLSEHSASYLKTAPDNFFRRNIYYRNSVHEIFKQALAVTNVSETVGEVLQQTFQIRQFTVIRNTVDENLFYYKGKKEGPFRFIHVSTMNYQKNINGLINGFEKFAGGRNDVQLILVGPIGEDTKQRIRNSEAVAKITFTGEVPYREVARLMQDADCFVLFSRYENFPCVIIEALCCGLPVITSDAGGAGEGIDASNGIIVPSENESALIEAMRKMKDDYRYDRKMISENARQKYGYPRIGKEFSTLYSNLHLMK